MHVGILNVKHTQQEIPFTFFVPVTAGGSFQALPVTGGTYGGRGAPKVHKEIKCPKKIPKFLAAKIINDTINIWTSKRACQLSRLDLLMVHIHLKCSVMPHRCYIHTVKPHNPRTTTQFGIRFSKCNICLLHNLEIRIQGQLTFYNKVGLRLVHFKTKFLIENHTVSTDRLNSNLILIYE